MMSFKKMANGDVMVRMAPEQLRAIRRGLGALSHSQWPGGDEFDSFMDLADVDDLVNGELHWND